MCCGQTLGGRPFDFMNPYNWLPEPRPAHSRSHNLSVVSLPLQPSQQPGGCLSLREQKGNRPNSLRKNSVGTPEIDWSVRLRQQGHTLQDAQKGRPSHPPNPGAPRRAFSQTRPQRATKDDPSKLARVRCPQDDPDESLAARVQRGSSETARCASTGGITGPSSLCWLAFSPSCWLHVFTRA
jgi:hypothetical protein